MVQDFLLSGVAVSLMSVIFGQLMVWKEETLMPTRLLGIQIANGFSSEARVAAGLMGHAERAELTPFVLHHHWDGDRQSAGLFQQASRAEVRTLDFGWRSQSPDRSLPAKVQARVRFLSALPRALTLARQINPDVVYSSQQLWDCQAATYLARKLGRPQVIHLHYVIGPWLHPPVLDRLRTCDHVLAISEFIREEALRHGVAPANVTVLRNTVPTSSPPEPGVREAVRRELGIASDALLLGIIARLDPDKGQSDTLRAFALAARAHPAARLLLAGSETPWHPGYGERLKKEAAELGIAGQTHFLGQRADVPRLMAALDIFVHPSRHEPFGLALAEASAAGLPVIAYAEGGTGEVVQDEVTGLLAAPGDWQALARSAQRLIDDPTRARALGRAGRERIARNFQLGPAAHAFTMLVKQFSPPTPGDSRVAAARPHPDLETDSQG